MSDEKVEESNAISDVDQSKPSKSFIPINKMPRCKAMNSRGEPCGDVRMRDSDYCRNHHPETLRKKEEERKRKEQLKGITHFDVNKTLNKKKKPKPELPGALSHTVLPVIPESSEDIESGGGTSNNVSELYFSQVPEHLNVKYELGYDHLTKVQHKKQNLNLLDLREETAILQHELNRLLRRQDRDSKEVLELTKGIKDLIKTHFDIERDRVKIIYSKEYVDTMLDSIIKLFMNYIPEESKPEALQKLKEVRDIHRS